jgi:hypothetical protein
VDERLCVQDAWWNFSDAPDICKAGLVATDFYTCATPRKIGESCGPLAPCGDFVGAIGDRLSLSCVPFVQQCMPASGETEEEIFPPELCAALRSQPFQSLASESGLTMNWGLSQTASAGISESYEVGTVYVPDGRYGCYLTQCFGGGIDLSVGFAACAGTTSPYSAFPGDDKVFTLGVSTPIAQIGFSTTNTIPPGEGSSACLDYGLSAIPVSGLLYDCSTFVDLVGAFDPVTGNPKPLPPPPRYFMSVSKGGTGTGSVSADGCTGLPGCLYGTEVTVTATPDTNNGSTFAGWSGYLCEGTGPCTVKMTDHKRVTAMFKGTPELVTVVKEGTGYCGVTLGGLAVHLGASNPNAHCIFEDSLDDGPGGPTQGQTRVFGGDSPDSCTLEVFPDADGTFRYNVLEWSPCLSFGAGGDGSCGGDYWDLNWEQDFSRPSEWGFEKARAKTTILTGWGGDGSTGTPTEFHPEVYDFRIDGIKQEFAPGQSSVVVVRCDKELDLDLRILGRRTPASNPFGWNNGEVMVSFDCLNSAVDLAPGSPPDPVVLSSEGAGQSVTGVCEDEFGFTREETISGINIDLTPPEVVMPQDRVVEQADPAGTRVYFAAIVYDSLSGVQSEGDNDSFADCSFVSAEGTLFPAMSGMRFPPGLTTVDCKASDRAGNIVTGSFTITVVDGTAPTLILPPPIVVDATGLEGAAVSYTVSANDGEGFTESGIPQAIEVIPSCSPQSGSVFPIGSSVVDCSATDRAGNSTSGEFSVTVLNTVALTKDDCKDVEWAWHFGSDGELFRNQGDCIQFVNTGK